MTTSERENLVIEFLSGRTYTGLAWRYLHSQDDLEDAMQRTAEIALKRLPLDHPHPDKWLGLVLKNECLNIIRKHKRLVPMENPTHDGAGPSTPAGMVELRDALDGLTTLQREAIIGHASGYAYSEIEERLGASPASIRHSISRGRKKLRKMVSLEA